MAHEVGVTLVIGSALAAGFYGVVSTAHTALKDLGSVAERVQKRQLLLGRAIDRFASSGKPVDGLRRRYDELGKTLEACRRKSEQLSRSIMKGAALKDARAAHLNAMRSQVASTIAVGAPVLKTVMDSARFSDALRDIAITGELDAQQERAAGHGLRHVAMRTNQSATDLAAGVGTLIANGMEVDKALAQAELLGKFTTATRASFDDAARMMVSFDTLGVSAENMALAFSQAASAGKQGSFEVRDMARWFPQLGGLMKGLGVTGNEAVVSMASRLQVAMKTAGSTDEAANNLKNFLAKITSRDTIKAFDDAGIDLRAEMLSMASKGMDPLEGAVTLVMGKISQQSPQVAAELQNLGAALAAIQDPAERAAEMERRRTMIEALGQRTGLGELFVDMQAVSYLLAEVQNRGELGKIRAATQTGRLPDGTLAVDADFAKRLDSPVERMKQLKIGLEELSLSVGEILLPPLSELVKTVTPMVAGIAAWAKEHPALIKGVLGLALGLSAGKLAIHGFAWAVNFLCLAPVRTMITTIHTIGARWLWLKALWQTKGLARQFGRLAAARAALVSVGGAIVQFGRGLLMFFVAPLQLAARAVPVLARGLGIAARAVLFLGRALLMTPIGLAVTAIAGAAYLIYRYWEPIKGFFGKLWEQVRALFGRACTWITDTVTNLGNTVVSALGALPGKVMEFGSHLVDGLVGGIKNRLAAAKESIVNFGSSIKNWFASTLGIHSPSRVFLGFGRNIGEGAVAGIGQMRTAAARAAGALALAATAALPPAAAADPFAAAAQSVSNVSTSRHLAGTHLSAGAITVHFNPTINVSGVAGNVREQVQQGLRVSLRELEQLLRRVQAEQSRRSF